MVASDQRWPYGGRCWWLLHGEPCRQGGSRAACSSTPTLDEWGGGLLQPRQQPVLACARGLGWYGCMLWFQRHATGTRMVIVEVPPSTPARRARCSLADRVPLPACAPHRPAADPGHSGRAHQPRGVALVQRPCGQWQVGAVVCKGGGACGWGAAACASQMSITPRTLLLKCACVPTWCCWRSRPTAPAPSVPAAQLPQFVLCLPAHPHRGSAASGCSSLASQQASAPSTSAAPACTHARTHAAAGAQWWTRGGRRRLAAT